MVSIHPKSLKISFPIQLDLYFRDIKFSFDDFEHKTTFIGYIIFHFVFIFYVILTYILHLQVLKYVTSRNMDNIDISKLNILSLKNLNWLYSLSNYFNL